MFIKEFKASELKLVSKANPEDAAYILEGAVVWLRSGSPPMKVCNIHNGQVNTCWKHEGMMNNGIFPIESLTPEPSPINNN